MSDGRPKAQVRNERLVALLDAVLAGEDPRELYDALIRASGAHDARANTSRPGSAATDLGHALGESIARAGARGAALTEGLLEHAHASCIRVGLLALAARAADPRDPSNALMKLHDKADQPEKARRDAVIEALAYVVRARGDNVVPKLDKFMDGFLHAYVALEALTTRSSLDKITSSPALLERLTEAFDLADESSRSAERAQGVRLLREGFPGQIARIVARYADAIPWLEERLTRERPETREILGQTLEALKKVSFSEAEVKRLSEIYDAHAPVPRDPTRIVKGTRRRGR